MITKLGANVVVVVTTKLGANVVVVVTTKLGASVVVVTPSGIARGTRRVGSCTQTVCAPFRLKGLRV